MPIQKCEHNHLDGMMASRFIARYLRDLVATSSRLRTKTQARVEELFKARLVANGSPDPRVALQGQLAAVEEELATVKRNLALAKTDAVFAAVSETFAELTSEKNKIFASFRPLQLRKRVVNRLGGGVVTFATAAPPVALYEGPTARKRIKSEAAAAIAVQSGEDVPLPGPVGSGREGKSSGNVSRGDKTPIELFCGPLLARERPFVAYVKALASRDTV
jgi:hypothetical protein